MFVTCVYANVHRVKIDLRAVMKLQSCLPACSKRRHGSVYVLPKPKDACRATHDRLADDEPRKTPGITAAGGA